jgi:hypothetical protein
MFYFSEKLILRINQMFCQHTPVRDILQDESNPKNGYMRFSFLAIWTRLNVRERRKHMQGRIIHNFKNMSGMGWTPKRNIMASLLGQISHITYYWTQMVNDNCKNILAYITEFKTFSAHMQCVYLTARLMQNFVLIDHLSKRIIDQRSLGR